MASFFNKFRWIARVAMLVLAINVQQVSAEILPGATDRITQLSQAFGKLGLDAELSQAFSQVGLDAEIPQASVIASDMLFVLEELERLAHLSGEINDDLTACGDPKNSGELSLQLLSNPECLSVLLSAERARWRTSAELAAQIHLLARHSLIETLPLGGLGDLEDDARATAIAWWRESGPATLEAYARIGREWIKKVEAESEIEREQAKANILDALDRIALEPGALRLHQVLLQNQSQEALRKAFMPLMERANLPEEQLAKLNAAAEFAGVFDGLMSRQIEELFGQDSDETCSELQELALPWDTKLPPFESHCSSAIALVLEVAKSEGDLATDEFQQALVLAFEERILTMRLLLAKLNRVSALEEDSTCSEVMGALNSSSGDKGRRPLDGMPLERRFIDQAAGGFTRLSQACLADMSPRWLAESCNAGRDPQEILDVFARMPARVGNRLEPKWSALIGVANDQVLGRMCNDPFKFLKEVRNGTYTPSDELQAAVDDLAETAEEVIWQTSISELRPYLDRLELPVQVFDDLVDRADLLCSEIIDILPPDASGDASKPEPLTAQMLRATLVDAGVLSSDGQRPIQLTTLCQVLSKRERVKDGTSLIELLENAEKDADEIVVSAAEVEAWAQGIMDRLNQDGEQIAVRFASGLVVAQGVDQVRQALSVADQEGEDRRCNAASLQDNETGETTPSLAPGIKISNFASQLDTSRADWSVALSAQVNLMLCGPIPHDQKDDESGVAGGQMQRARSIEAATAEIELGPITLGPSISAEKIAEDLFTNAREAAKDIEINEKELLEAVTDYLRVAGISDLNLIRGFDIETPGVEFEWDERGWARIRTSITSPLPEDAGFELTPIDLCLLLPVFAEEITDEDASCFLVHEIEGKLTEVLLEKVVQPVLIKVLSDLNMTMEGSFKDLGIDPEISSGYSLTDESTELTVVSKISIRSDDLKKLAGYGLEDDAPFSGDLVINIKVSSDGSYEIETELPRVSDAYFLNFLPAFPDLGFLQLAEIQQLPDGSSRSKMERCNPKRNEGSLRRIYRLALNDSSPVVGVLGFVCLDLALKNDPYFVAPRSGELRTPDDAWRLVFQTGDDIEFVKAIEGKNDNLLRIELELRVTEPSFERLDGRSVVVEINLESSAWRLPADARANRVTYSIIEEQLSRQLPQGIRLYGVEFSSGGIKLLLTPPDVEQVFASLKDGILSNVDLDALQGISNTACEVAPLLGLAEMIRSGLKAEALPTCKYDPLVHEVDIRGADIAWSCTETGNGDQLGNCDIVFDDELTICEDRLKIGVRWDSSRKPEFDDDELVECLEDHIANVFPDSIGPRIKVEPPKLSDDCVANLARCRLTSGVEVDFSDAFDEVDLSALGLGGLGLEGTTCGNLSEELVAKMSAAFAFDGTSRISFAAGNVDFAAELKQCIADISIAVAGTVAAETGLNIDRVLEEAATHGRELLLATSAELNEVTDDAVECKLDLSDSTSPGCEELSKDILRQGSLRGVRFESEYSIFDTNIQVSVGFTFELAALAPEALLTGQADLGQLWKELRDSAKVSFDLGCKGKASSECLSDIGNTLAKDLPGGIVSYDGGLQIVPGSDRTAIKIPLRVKYDEFGLDLSVVVDCGLETPDWNQVSLNCSSDPEEVILEAIAQGLASLPDVELDLGLASVSLSDPEYRAAQGLVSMKAVASFEGLDLLPEGFDKAQGTVTIGRDLELDIQIGWDALVNGASEHLAEAVNGLVGDFLPVKIVDVKIDRTNPNTGIPEQIGIESVATIVEVISLSAPRIVLSEDGLKIDGPNRFSIELPDGFSIPVPPIAICPNGGAIEDKELTLTANITIGECTASGILKFAGSVTVFLDRPRVETLGKLVVLTVLPLGHSEGVFDLGKRIISHETEIGGVMSDIIRMRTEFNANGNLMTVTANGDIDVFKTRVGEGNFDLNLNTGVLNSDFNADIGIAQGQGFIRTGSGFSRPEAEIDGHMGIGGFPVMGSFIEARARFAKIGVSIWGLRLAVAFPGLDLLDPSKIADLLKDLLTPNFENLDEALEALLSGNITMNPFSDFGSGGDGMGDSSDGDAGESAGGDGAKDGGEGDPGEQLGNEEAPAEANSSDGPAAPVPPNGVAAGGLAGTETAPLWFAIDQATKHVRIGTGTQGGDDEKIVALAEHDLSHFDDAGTRKGNTLVLLDRGYTQILPSEPFSVEPCKGAAQQDRILVLYAGIDAPRQGMYELCRLRDVNNTPVSDSFFSSATDETLRDIAALQDALAAELLSRGIQGGYDHGRILLKARLIETGAPSGLRGVLAFQRPGELLVAVRGRFKQGTCGEAAEPDEGAEIASKIFILKGFGAGDLDEPETILKAVRAVWACDPGSLARFDPRTFQLSTSSTISTEAAEGFNVVAELPEIEIVQQTSSSWAATLLTELEERKEEQREKEEQDQVNEELRERVAQSQVQGWVAVPACQVDCEPLAVRFDSVSGGKCQLTVNANTFEFTKGAGLFKDDCNPARPEFTWVDLSPPLAILGTTAEVEPAQIELGLFSVNGLDKSNPLGFGIVLEKFTFEESSFLTSLPAFVRARGGQIQDLKSLRHPLGQIAAILSGSSGRDSHWRVLNSKASFNISMEGPDLPMDRAQALLPYLTSNMATAEIWENGDVQLLSSEAYLLLRWSGDKWELILRLERTPGQDHFEDHVLTNVSDEAVDPKRNRDARLIPFDEQLGGWGFAAVDRDTGNGDIFLKTVAEPTLVDALQPIETWLGSDTRSGFEPSKFLWFKLELQPETTSFRVTSIHGKVDSVICLYDANLEYLAGDDDSYPPSENRSAQLDYRVNSERPPAWIRISEFGKDEDLPEDLVVSLKKIDAVTIAGDPRTECENKHIEIPEPDYFGNSFIETNIVGLSAAKDDPIMLSTLANGVFTETLPNEFELIAVPVHGGRKLSYVTFLQDGVQYVLRPDPDSLEFKPFFKILGDTPSNTGTLGRAIGEVLSRFGETERTLYGQSIVVEGVQSWSAMTMHGEQSRQLLFLEQGDNNATIALRSPNIDDRLLANIVRYVTTNDWPTVTDVQAEPLVLEVRTKTCANAECPRKLVHLEATLDGAFPQAVIGDDPVDSPLFARWLEVFTDTVAHSPDAAFNQEVYHGSGVAGLYAFRLLRSGPLYLVGSDGWACADALGLPLRGTDMRKLLDAMVGNFDPGWQISPAKFCETAHFKIDVGPAGGPDGVLLTRLVSDDRLSLFRVPLDNPANAAVTEPSVPLPANLAEIVRDEFSARLRARGASALTGMDLLDESKLRDGRDIWVFGDSSGTVGIDGTLAAWSVAFMFSNPLSGKAEDEEVMLACMLTGISVALPPSTDGDADVVEAALVSIRNAVSELDTCNDADGAIINVRKDPDGGFSAFFQEIRDFGALQEDHGPTGFRIASVKSPALWGNIVGMLEDQQRDLHLANSKTNIVATFNDREVQVDFRAMRNLTEPEQSNLLRQIVERLDTLSQKRAEWEFKSLELECEPDTGCRTLTGRWPIECRVNDPCHDISGSWRGIAWVAVQLDSSGLSPKSFALAINSRPSVDLAIDLARRFETPAGAVYEVLRRAERQLAWNVLNDEVRFREALNQEWEKLGKFSEEPTNGSESARNSPQVVTIRDAVLRRIIDVGLSFDSPQWLLETGSGTPPVGVAISFERSGIPLGLVVWETIMSNGSSGPLYWRDANEPLPVEDIIAHVASRKLKGGRLGLWLPRKRSSEPQMLAPLAASTEQTLTISSLHSINDLDDSAEFSFLPNCEGSPDRLRNLVLGLSRLDPGESGTCRAIDKDITLLVAASSIAQGLVATTNEWQWFDLADLQIDRDSTMHAFAAAMKGTQPDDEIKLTEMEGRVLAFADVDQVWWKTGLRDVAWLGRFENVAPKDADHWKLLSRVAGLALSTPPTDGEIFGTAPLLRADLTARRTAILGNTGVIDLRTFVDRSADLPMLPDWSLDEGKALLRQHGNYPVLFDLDDADMVSGKFSMSDPNQAWNDMGELSIALAKEDAKNLADMLIEIATRYAQRPTFVGQFQDGSFVACQDAPNGNVDVFKSQVAAGFVMLEIEGMACDDPQISSERVRNAFDLLENTVCSPGNGLLFMVGAEMFFGLQDEAGPTDTGCLFIDPFVPDPNPICEHFPVQHPARDKIAQLFGDAGFCNKPQLTDILALIELNDEVVLAISQSNTRQLRMIQTDATFVRSNASTLLNWITGLQSDCTEKLSVMRLDPPTEIVLLEDPCHGLDLLDGGSHEEMLRYVSATRHPMAENLLKKIGNFTNDLRDLGPLDAQISDDYVLIKLRTQDVLVLHKTVDHETRMRASLPDAVALLETISIEMRYPINVLYEKVDDPSGAGGPIIHIATLIEVDQRKPLSQPLEVSNYEGERTLGWSDFGVHEIELGFPLFDAIQISSVAYEWLRQQSLGKVDSARSWLGNKGLPKFFVILRDDKVLFRLIDTKGHETCKLLELEEANDILDRLTQGSAPISFSESWPPAMRLGDPGWYVPLSQDPRLALYDDGRSC